MKTTRKRTSAKTIPSAEQIAEMADAGTVLRRNFAVICPNHAADAVRSMIFQECPHVVALVPQELSSAVNYTVRRSVSAT